MPLTFADTVTPEKVAWLWPGYIPFGKVSMLDGDPGLGKSTVLIDIAARLSRGEALPNGKQHPPMGTILLMGEDGAGDTIVPRLINAEGDLTRVAIRDTYTNDKEQEIPPSFPSDLTKLKEDIIAAQAGMVVIDPVMSYLDPDINSNNDQQVRRALMPLAMLAEETGAAIVLLRHLNKGAGSAALYRGGGSIAFVGVARSGLILVRDPDDPARAVLASTKSNLGPPPPSLAFTLSGCPNGAAQVNWEGHSAHTAETLVQQQQGGESERATHKEAVAFLTELLADHLPLLSREVWKQANEAGHARHSILKAKDTLGVKVGKARTQDGAWTWTLPRVEESKNSTGGASDNTADTNSLDSSLTISKNLNNLYSPKGQQTPPADSSNPEKQQPTPFNAPRVVKAGRYECAHCYREVWLSEGAPQLCPQHRRGLDVTGTDAGRGGSGDTGIVG